MGNTLNKIIINQYGWTPLHAACYFGRLDIVKYLIECENFDPNDENLNGWHSLIFAVMGGHGAKVVEYLMTVNQIKIDHHDVYGKNALTYAESIYPDGSVEYLI